MKLRTQFDMINLRQRLLDGSTDRNLDLINLMKICKTNAQIINVVCVGAGDVFINRYWPTLQKYITAGDEQEINEAHCKIKLLICDQFPLDVLIKDRVSIANNYDNKTANKIEASYKILLDQLNEINQRNELYEIIYINLKDPNENKWYLHSGADIVFILAPDGVHVQVAKEWFRKASLIVIEKPYNRILEEAAEFEKLMNEFYSSDTIKPGTWVIPFDHYLAKIAGLSLEPQLDKYFESIGTLENIEFQLTESRPLEIWRAQTLEEGLIYDLFSHVLALLTTCLDLNSFRTKDILQFHVAQHSNSPIQKETFAFFEFKLMDIKGNPVIVKGSIGKGISNQDEKFINFHGNNGCISCHFAGQNSNPGIYKKLKSRTPELRFSIRDGHKELIEHILNGQYCEEPIGGLLGQEALQIMRIMNSFRELIDRHIMMKYKLGSSPNDICKLQGTKIK